MLPYACRQITVAMNKCICYRFYNMNIVNRNINYIFGIKDLDFFPFLFKTKHIKINLYSFGIFAKICLVNKWRLVFVEKSALNSPSPSNQKGYYFVDSSSSLFTILKLSNTWQWVLGDGQHIGQVHNDELLKMLLRKKTCTL